MSASGDAARRRNVAVTLNATTPRRLRQHPSSEEGNDACAGRLSQRRRTGCCPVVFYPLSGGNSGAQFDFEPEFTVFFDFADKPSDTQAHQFSLCQSGLPGNSFQFFFQRIVESNGDATVFFWHLHLIITTQNLVWLKKRLATVTVTM
ncbi:MAG: hypothetical protein LBD30_06480 [Verrucomicrobiales bacterium]|jgi:hypothetical protein|nr:hypothetical protein [Verrucomicrobiales bacterium]